MRYTLQRYTHCGSRDAVAERCQVRTLPSPNRGRPHLDPNTSTLCLTENESTDVVSVPVSVLSWAVCCSSLSQYADVTCTTGNPLRFPQRIHTSPQLHIYVRCLLVVQLGAGSTPDRVRICRSWRQLHSWAGTSSKRESAPCIRWFKQFILVALVALGLRC